MSVREPICVRTPRNLPVLALAASILFAGMIAAQSGEKYVARLSSVPVDAASRAVITGHGSANAVLSGNVLVISGSFQGVPSKATIAQLHRGSMRGVRGPAVFDLTVSNATEGSISGSCALSADQADGLRKGEFYVQIHSEKAPDGNLWGWLLR